MLKTVRPVAVAAVLAIGSATLVTAETLGDKYNRGEISGPAVTQLISGTDLSMETALQMTLDDVIAERWQDD